MIQVIDCPFLFLIVGKKSSSRSNAGVIVGAVIGSFLGNIDFNTFFNEIGALVLLVIAGIIWKRRKHTQEKPKFSIELIPTKD